MKPLDALLKKRSCLLVRILMYKHKELNNNVACITTERDQAHPLEKCYILEYNPRDNHMRYEEYRNAVNIVINESEFDGIFVSNATFELPF